MFSHTNMCAQSFARLNQSTIGTNGEIHTHARVTNSCRTYGYAILCRLFGRRYLGWSSHKKLEQSNTNNEQVWLPKKNSCRIARAVSGRKFQEDRFPRNSYHWLHKRFYVKFSALPFTSTRIFRTPFDVLLWAFPSNYRRLKQGIQHQTTWKVWRAKNCQW